MKMMFEKILINIHDVMMSVANYIDSYYLDVFCSYIWVFIQNYEIVMRHNTLRYASNFSYRIYLRRSDLAISSATRALTNSSSISISSPSLLGASNDISSTMRSITV